MVGCYARQTAVRLALGFILVAGQRDSNLGSMTQMEKRMGVKTIDSVTRLRVMIDVQDGSYEKGELLEAAIPALVSLSERSDQLGEEARRTISSWSTAANLADLADLGDDPVSATPPSAGL